MNLRFVGFWVTIMMVCVVPGAWAAPEQSEAVKGQTVSVHFPRRVRPQPAISIVGGIESAGPKAVASEAAPSRLWPRPDNDGKRAWNQLYQLKTAPTEAEPGGCADDYARSLRRRVGVTRFQLLDSEGAVLGRLDNVAKALPRMLTEALSARERVLMHSAFDRQLYDRTFNAPTVQAVDRRLTRASELTRAMGVQFVISGVVRDIGVEDPGAWGTSTASWLGRGLGISNQRRRLALDLFVYDGLSGMIVMQDQIEVRGDWGRAPEADVGFATPAFLATDFGARIAERVSELADTVVEKLACQPFIASVERVDGERVRISAGADSGLRPGQSMELLRAERYLDQPGAYPALRPIGQTLEVEQVQPRFSSGHLPVEGGRINVRRGDRVVVW
ncbi:flagella assembly protein FlgT middle domain-containing protein [Salicola sp. Rm-C-2C1-2]|uniref:flagella assembly protein FlgT middle domain-containing protein n=1 Tax=Salicola sp. Rm-C-2C1-2 TaxID=3141321 RepID=UPI0032E4D981